MRQVVLTKEECSAGVTQIGARLDQLNASLIQCKDPARIKELVHFMEPIQSLRDKLITAMYP